MMEGHNIGGNHAVFDHAIPSNSIGNSRAVCDMFGVTVLVQTFIQHEVSALILCRYSLDV